MRKHQNILKMILTRKTECVKLLNYNSYSTQQLFSYHLTYKMTKDTRTPLCSCPPNSSLRWEKVNLIFTLLSVLRCYQYSFHLPLFKDLKRKEKKKGGEGETFLKTKSCAFSLRHSVKKIGVFWIIIISFMPWLVTKSLL